MRWIVDNSALQRLPRSPSVGARLQAMLTGGDVLCSVPPTVLEAGFSVRSPSEHVAVVDQLTAGLTPLPLLPDVGDIATDLQRALWTAGQGRAAGVVDLLIAACAVVHGAGIVHYDSDFETLSRIDSRVVQQWVVPRGSVD